MFSCETCEIFKSTYCEEYLRTTALLLLVWMLLFQNHSELFPILFPFSQVSLISRWNRDFIFPSRSVQKVWTPSHNVQCRMSLSFPVIVCRRFEPPFKATPPFFIFFHPPPFPLAKPFWQYHPTEIPDKTKTKKNKKQITN